MPDAPEPSPETPDHIRLIELRDGTALRIRPIHPDDRTELAEAYDKLSDRSRRRRFFSPPKRLSQSLLDYLTQLDGDTRFALVAEVLDESIPHGLGVARWVRSADDPRRADAAVTVVDEWQSRGLGTQLLSALIDEARSRGITTFTADVLWENDTVLGPLRALGASVEPAEPGIASIAFTLPAVSARLDDTALGRFFAAVASEPPTNAENS